MARGLRALPCAACQTQRASLDRLARAAARAPPGGARRGRRELCDDIQFRRYVQWLASDQWGAAREAAPATSRCLATCRSWSAATAPTCGRGRTNSASTPPSACRPMRSATRARTGACPVYRWDVLAERDFDWLRHRARRNADLFDGYRVDHLVGFYRTYFRPLDTAEPEFVPATKRRSSSSASACSRCSASQAPRSSPRTLASFPTSCARR